MIQTNEFIRNLIEQHDQEQTTMGHVQISIRILTAGFEYLGKRMDDPALVKFANDFSNGLTTEFFKILEEKYVLPRKMD